MKLKVADALVLWVAQGFGSGWSPVMPGTFGSLVGIGWLALLLSFENLAVFIGGQVLGIVVSIWICGRAELILGKSDPGCVVLDEIIAIPLCFTLPVLIFGNLLRIDSFLGKETWWLGLMGFVLFRLFDIWKPWPIGASQSLPGGWGVVADDLLAAVWVSVIMCVICWFLW